jgi:hypothetical protein
MGMILGGLRDVFFFFFFFGSNFLFFLDSDTIAFLSYFIWSMIIMFSHLVFESF